MSKFGGVISWETFTWKTKLDNIKIDLREIVCEYGR
jgi:hypothetical protein